MGSLWKVISVVATQIFFIFTPKIGEDSHFDSYFSDGLNQTTNQLWELLLSTALPSH